MPLQYTITEIDARNTRSLRAHERIGFETINRCTASNGVNMPHRIVELEGLR